MNLSRRPAETAPFAAALLVNALLCVLMSTRGTAARDETDPGEGLAASPAKYARYALGHRGDASAGEKLFRTHRSLQCTNCHNVIGMEKSGPNLDGVGDKFSREELIRQILLPSESITPGFEPVTLVLRDGRVISARVERANRLVYRIIDVEGKQRDIAVSKVASVQVSEVSLMPEGLATTLELSEFTDLIAYLETL